MSDVVVWAVPPSDIRKLMQDAVEVEREIREKFDSIGVKLIAVMSIWSVYIILVCNIDFLRKVLKNGLQFDTLYKRGINPLVLRLLLYIYKNQQYTVKWGNSCAPFFNVSNGVRQGGVSSGIFFVVYIDMLLEILRNSGFGCTVFGVFFGAMIYADDIFLLSASRSGLQVMIDICHKFAEGINLKFGTNIDPAKSKTKCIVFSQKKIRINLQELKLGGHRLPWVSHVKHLGHTLQSDNSMSMDMNQKRGAFISKVSSLMQEFHYATPHVLMTLVQSYACNLYGSNTWDLFSEDCQKICRSYNVSIRNIYRLPRTTHRYLLEPLTDVPHLYVQLLSRFVTFAKSILSNDAFQVRFLASLSADNLSTVLGRSLARISNLCNYDDDVRCLNGNMVKKKVKYMPIVDSETWRVGVIKDMKDVLNDDEQYGVISNDEAKAILEFACTS